LETNFVIDTVVRKDEFERTEEPRLGHFIIRIGSTPNGLVLSIALHD
jgi:hypothetical protein